MISAGARVADVGADHGQLVAILLDAGVATRAIAIDRSPDALAGARRHLSRFAPEQVDCRVGWGLSPLASAEADVAVIAGMGPREICRILEGAGPRLAELERVVVQPQGDVIHMRRWLAREQLQLEEEALIVERKVAHWVGAFAPRTRSSCRWSLDEVRFGPHLQRSPTAGYRWWLERQVERMATALREVREGASSRTRVDLVTEHAAFREELARVSPSDPMQAEVRRPRRG